MSLSPLPFGDMGGTKLTFSLGGNIYGIFSLVSGQKLTMKPSYTTNAAEIYLHSTLGLIESTQSLRVICLAGVGVFENQRGLSLPTSVPGFCRDPETCSPAAIDVGNNQNFRIAKEWEHCFTEIYPRAISNNTSHSQQRQRTNFKEQLANYSFIQQANNYNSSTSFSQSDPPNQ